MDGFDNKLKKESFRNFYRSFSKPFWFFILKICGDASMADDIFQESFYRFFRAAPGALDERQRKSYLYKTAVRLIIDQKKRIQVEHKYRDDSDGYTMIENRNMLSVDMQKIFTLLKPRERILLWLAYVDGYSHIEIARITGNREKSIKVQLFRIRRKFAGILRSHGYTGEESV
jgi:RNA polymerase sigma-70 factor (ECF subfamily)